MSLSILCLFFILHSSFLTFGRACSRSGKLKLVWLSSLLIAAFIFSSCTSEQVPPAEEQGAPVQIMSYLAPYEDVESTGTRADEWTPPTGYYEPIKHSSIGAFFTYSTVEQRHIWYYTTTTPNKWIIDKEAPAGIQYLYGFSPNEAAGASSVAPNSSYANGAILTLNNMGSVSGEDICILVGAKEGKSATEIADAKTLRRGDFSCTIYNGADTHNYLFMLFEHLYAAIDFQFHVDDTYAALRKIKLKKLELRGYSSYNSDDDNTLMKRKGINATVTLTANDDATGGTSPITSITFSQNATGDPMPFITFFDGEVEIPSGTVANSEELKYTDNVDYAYVVPNINNFYMLRSTYDVYDRSDHLIRENSIVENKIDMYRLFNSIPYLDRGKKYKIKLTLKPTYLYQLGNWDLDNPTVELN